MNNINISKIDLNVLKVFEALYEEGGASRAGLRLEVTQSAVSAALKRLRAIYGDLLFVRTGRGLAPTPRAHELKPVVTEVLNKFRESLDLGSENETAYVGRSILIGLSDDYEIAVGRTLLDEVENKMPGLRLAFRQTHSQIVSEMIMRHEIDLAITSGGLSSGLVSRAAVGEGSYACLIDPASTVSKKKIFTLDDYLERDHILISSGGFIGIVDEVLSSLGRQRRVVASTTHFSALPYLLKGSKSIATMPAHAAYKIAKIAGLKLVRCPTEMPRYPIEIGWRRSTLRDPIIAKVKILIGDVLSKRKWHTN